MKRGFEQQAGWAGDAAFKVGTRRCRVNRMSKNVNSSRLRAYKAHGKAEHLEEN